MSVEDIVKKEEVETYYSVGTILGRGKFATVKHITDKTTGTCYAAKYLRKRNHAVNCRNTILQEAELLQELVEHRSIVDVKEVFECTTVMIIVLELCTGGDLYHAIYADPFTEKESVYVLKQVIDALKFLHNKSILHLDIKPENILLINNQILDIKLADFGLAVKLSPTEEFKRIIGTPEYVAPEVINFESLTTASDMWSLGALTYALLCGYSPFLPEDDDSIGDEPSRFGEQADILSNVSQAKYDFDDEVFNEVSENAKDFIRSLLVKTPKRRLNADQCLRHQWLKTYDDTSLALRHFTDSPDFSKSTSSGLSDFSEFSVNLGSNMSADLYGHPTPGTPEESRIPEENETCTDSIANTEVEQSYNKTEATEEVTINKAKGTVDGKTIADTSSRNISKGSEEKFHKTSSPKEDRTEHKHGSFSSRIRNRDIKKPIHSISESNEEKISKSTIRRSEKTSPTASTLGEKDSKSESTDSKRKKNRMRSDTNLFVGIPGIPFKVGDYEHTTITEQKTPNESKYSTILEESNQFDSTENKSIDRDSPNHAKTPSRKRIAESTSTSSHEAIPSPLSSKTRVSKYGKNPSNNLEIPTTNPTHYRLDNLIRYFNYSDTTSSVHADTSPIETPSPSRPPSSSKVLRSIKGEKIKLESVRSLDPFINRSEISSLTQRRLSYEQLHSFNYKSSSQLSSTPATPTLHNNSFYSSSRDASRSVDNLKDLVDQDSRSSSPVFSSLAISRRGSIEYSTKTLPHMKSPSTTPQPCLCTAQHVRRIWLSYSKIDLEKVQLSNQAYKEHFLNESNSTLSNSLANHNNNSNQSTSNPRSPLSSPSANSIRYIRPNLFYKGMDSKMYDTDRNSLTSKTPYASLTLSHKHRITSHKEEDDVDVSITQSVSLYSLKDLSSPSSSNSHTTKYTPSTEYRSRKSVEQCNSYEPYTNKYKLNRTNCVTPENL